MKTRKIRRSGSLTRKTQPWIINDGPTQKPPSLPDWLRKEIPPELTKDKRNSAEAILREICGSVLSDRSIRYPTRIKDLRLRIERTVEDAIMRHCDKLVKAAQAKSTMKKTQEKIKEKEKEARAELAKNLRFSRNRLREIEKEMVHKTDSLEKLQLASNYPAPPPPEIKANKRGLGLPETCGIYFIWERGVIVYVGQSVRLSRRLRIGHHEKLREGNLISYIEFSENELYWAECYYIGTTCPTRNGPLRHRNRKTGTHSV